MLEFGNLSAGRWKVQLFEVENFVVDSTGSKPRSSPGAVYVDAKPVCIVQIDTEVDRSGLNKDSPLIFTERGLDPLFELFFADGSCV